MDRNKVLQEILLKETGRTFAADAIWEEIKRAAGEAAEGSQWIVGQDDPLEKWMYYVTVERGYDEEFDQWETSISLEEIIITDKKTGKEAHIQVRGAEL